MNQIQAHTFLSCCRNGKTEKVETLDGGSATASFGLNLHKFGEILFAENCDEFIFCCTFCIEIFFEYTEFLKHAKRQHNIVVQAVDLDEEEQYKSSSCIQFENGEVNQCTVPNATGEPASNSSIPIVTPAPSVFDETTEYVEEVIWNTSTNSNDMSRADGQNNGTIQTVAKDDYNIEYLLDGCLEFDETALHDVENIYKCEMLEEQDTREQPVQDSDKPRSSSYCASHSIIRNKRLLWYFIELYKTHPCLWRADHKHIVNHAKRFEAVEQMAATMHQRFCYQVTISKVVKTIRSMRACYLREFHRKSQNVLYTPKLWYYRKLSFIEYALSYESEREKLEDILSAPPTPKCSNCQREFKTKYGLTQHLRMHVECKPFTCEYCKKTFRSAANLQAHATSHLPAAERRYTCEFCGLKIALQHNYLVHLRRHTKQFPYHCLICGSGSPNSTELKNHMLEHTGERPYCCEVCGMTFKLHGTLTRHRERHDYDHTTDV